MKRCARFIRRMLQRWTGQRPYRSATFETIRATATAICNAADQRRRAPMDQRE
jgi:hypothetical protein